MMNKRVRILSACALALAVTISGLTLPGAYAADAVDTGETCSIEFNLSKNVYGSGENATDFAELSTLPIQVKLYKVATITETGAYNAVTGFEELNLDSISNETSAADWEEKAVKAKEVIEKNTTSPTATAVLNGGTGKAEGLATGMYLIVPQEVQSPYYTYSFKENLISLPNNYYDPTQSGSSDAWVYNLNGTNAVGLKPDRQERKGSLEIIKTLASYNATSGGATFVFNVEVKKLDGTVTNNVYKIAFNRKGQSSRLIENLPAGAKVTVTEVYSGANYTLEPSDEQKVEIVADSKVQVRFKNYHNGGQNGGSGIENHFYDNKGIPDWKNDLNAEGGAEK
ncbi:hypothetical protein JQM69_07945 [Faecalicatena contorta]|uniref:DUF5979 domain-containing protein n=1 Tax=Faecalicatena contorta TaxID=39482 RepID=UPI001F21D8B3|nr:DUF5979 domain-containing protein [Faecalicatena contorta]MCF2680625.1 hypothetical protein [Faecalicatena contorta]